MSNKRTKYSTVVVKTKSGTVVCYLSETDEKRGLDAQFDLMGYDIIAL